MSTRVFSRVFQFSRHNLVRWKGHSKWANIKHTKGAMDEAYSKLSSRYSLMISVAVKDNNGVTDRKVNKSLDRVIKEALAQNIRQGTIDTAIKKSLQVKEVEHTFELRCASSRAAFIVEMIGVSKGEMETKLRTLMKKNGGLQEPGLRNMFDKKGIIIVHSGGAEMDEVESDAIEYGVEEVEEEGKGMVTMICSPSDFADVMEKITAKYQVEHSGIEYLPNVTVDFSSNQDKAKFYMLYKALKQHELVVAVHHNANL